MAVSLGIAAGPLLAIGIEFTYPRGQAIASPKMTTINIPINHQEAVIADIQLRVMGRTEPFSSASFRSDTILQSLSFQPGDVYDEQQVLIGLSQLEPFAENITLSVEPAAEPNQIALIITAEKPDKFFFRFGKFPSPTALRGPLRRATTSTIDNRASGFAVSGYGGIANIGDSGQSVAIGITGGENALGFEVDYTIPLGGETGLAFNLANQPGVETEFDNGEINVDLPGGEDP